MNTETAYSVSKVRLNYKIYQIQDKIKKNPPGEGVPGGK